MIVSVRLVLVIGGAVTDVTCSSYVGCFIDGGYDNRVMVKFVSNGHAMKDYMTIDYCISLCTLKGDNTQ